MDYLDFDIDIERSGAAYRATFNSPAGQVTQDFVVPFTEQDLEIALLRFGRPQRGTRRIENPETEYARTFGSRLFAAVFDGEARACLRSSLEEAQRRNAGLRLRLRLTGTPELTDLPWEFLHNPTFNRFLALSSQTPLVRYLEMPERVRPLAISLPLRILAVISSPRGYPPLNVEDEWQRLSTALADLQAHGLVQLERLAAPTLSALQRQLRRGSYHVLHFIGHGSFDEQQQDGVLLMEDNEGYGARVSSRDLGVILHDHGALRLVVLNACEGGRSSRSDPFAGAAQSLVQQGIPAVIAMQFPVTDEAAIAFSEGFYSALTDGYPVDGGLAEARKGLLNIGGGTEWGTPVLYMRSPDGRLFELPALAERAASAAPAPVAQPPAATPTPAVRNFVAAPAPAMQSFVAAPLLPTPPSMPARPVRRATRSASVFISYKRNTRLDEPLAQILYESMRAAGHDVFIDQKMHVGVEWAREIEQRILASDYVIVLLSEESVNSEMVAMEVECAANQMQSKNKSCLLPVRIDYTATLPYELSHLLDRIQYTSWNDDSGTAALIDQLLDAIDARVNLPQTAPAAPSAPAPSALPRPAADPRFIESLHEPGGSVRLNSDMYIERDADRRLQREMSKPEGTTITIRAPRQAGKTSLLMRGISQAQKAGSKIVRIDMQALDERVTQSLDACLRYFAELLFRSLRLDTSLVEQGWKSSLGAPDKTTYLMEDHILPLGTNIVLAIDEADRLLSTSFHDTFFGLLRFWHNNRAMSEDWDRLDILMVISTEPHLLISDVSQSPFNVGTKLVLPDFTAAQVAELNGRYRSPLSDAELPEFLNLLGGHPYLSNRALYTILNDQISWSQLSADATSPQSPFYDHLKRFLWMLRDKPDLVEALRQVMARGRCPDEVAFYRLMQAGLIQGIDSQSCACRCTLYERYLKDKLQ